MRMYIKASKAMCKEINKFFKEKSIPYFAVHTRCNEFDSYRYNADFYAHPLDCEWDKNSKRYYQYISILYPENYYALPSVLTTRRLNDIFNRCKPTLLPDFMNQLFEEIAI